VTEPTLWAHVRARLGMGSRAIHVTVRPVVAAEVWLTVAYGVPSQKSPARLTPRSATDWSERWVARLARS